MTRFNLTTPCSNCPFRKVGGIRLRRDRATEIARLFLDAQGGAFPCHKTVDYSVEDDGEPRPMREGESMCAGGLLFAEKQGRANQLMRVMERLGAYDPSKLRGADEVFDSLRQMVQAQPERRKARTR